MRIKTEVEVSESRIADLLCAAMEGGTGYWAQIVGYREPKEVWRVEGWDTEVYKHIHWPMSEGGAMIIADEDKRYKVTRDGLFAGLRKMATDPRYRDHFHNFMDENEDATMGDVFLQLAVLGEVVYG